MHEPRAVSDGCGQHPDFPPQPPQNPHRQSTKLYLLELDAHRVSDKDFRLMSPLREVLERISVFLLVFGFSQRHASARINKNETLGTKV
jgi:hypothetical protein